MIPREVIEAIRERVDLVELVSETVTLRRAGTSHLGLCPFHQEKSPSFNVVPHKGIFHCFGCGKGGDCFKWMMETQGLSFEECVRALGQRVGVAVPDRDLSPQERRQLRARADLYEVCTMARDWFQSNLLTRPVGKEALAYLRGRGMRDDIIQKYGLGFAPDAFSGLLDHLHQQGVPAQLALRAGLARPRRQGGGAYDLFRGRVIIPIHDPRGRVIAFGGRVMPGAPVEGDHKPPKYVNSPETEIYKKSSVLYGLSQARAAVQQKKRMLVVEGYFDVLSLHQAGFTEAVATCGTALTSDHMRTIRPLATQVYTLFDLDEAGQRAALKSLPLFLEAGIVPYRIATGEGKDPDEIIQSEGAVRFEEMIDGAEAVVDLLVRRVVQQYGADAGALDRVLEELAPILRLYRDAARFKVVERIARMFNLPVAAVDERMGRAPARVVDGPVAPPLRWRGSKELNHLLWLLVHRHAQAGPVVAAFEEPELVSRRESALFAVRQLLEGHSLPSILEALEGHDPDLVRVLLAVAARDQLYSEEEAAGAAGMILDKLRAKWIRAELRRLEQALAGCDPSRDGSRYRSLLEKRQKLQRDLRK